MIVIVLFNYITTTASINKQLREQRLYEELGEIKDEIERKWFVMAIGDND